MEQAQLAIEPGRDPGNAPEAEAATPVKKPPNERVAGVHKVLGVLYVAFAVLAVVALALILIVDEGTPDERRSAGLALMMGAVAGPLLMAALHFVLSYGARLGRGWARWFSMLVGFMLLGALPIGTVFGLILLENTFKRWK